MSFQEYRITLVSQVLAFWTSQQHAAVASIIN